MMALNKKAVEDIRSLHFQAAKYWLEVALAISETADLGHHETTARTHVHLAVVHSTGYKDRQAAVEQFLLALTINPNITITPGLETPALRSAYLRAREKLGLPPNPDLTPTAPGQGASPAPIPPMPPTQAAAREVGPAGPSEAAKPGPAPPTQEIETQGYRRLLENAGLTGITDPDPPAVIPSPLHCPLPFQVPYGEPLLVRCLTQKGQSRSSAVLYYGTEGKSATYVALPMERSPKGWLVAVIPGQALWGESLTYYVKAQVPGVEEAVYSGHPEDPNTLIVTPPKDELADEEPAPLSRAPAGREAGRPSPRRAPGSWWFALGGGSGLAYHGRETVDTNSKAPDSQPVSVNSGFSFAGLFQLEPEIGYQWTRRLSISVMGRYQVAPKQGDFVPRAGENEIRTSALAGFARARLWLAGKSNWQPHLSAGLGGGTSFLATIGRHCPQRACTLDHSDTLHGGALGLTFGVGVLYQVSPRLGLFADVNEIATLPEFMALTELSIGIAYTYDPRGGRSPGNGMAAGDRHRR